MKVPETHGRWPLVAGAALAPVAVLSIRDPRLRPLLALFAHQTEEWVWPGGFLPWINETVIGSDDPEFPIDRRAGFLINVGFGWGLSLSTLAGPKAAGPQTALYVSHLGNAALHLSWAAKHRRYDPGCVTAVTTLLPTALIGLHNLYTNPQVKKSSIRNGVVAGAAIGLGIMPLMKRRLKRRSKRQQRDNKEIAKPAPEMSSS